MEMLGPKTPVIVTGGASGVGRGACIALAEHGRPIAVWTSRNSWRMRSPQNAVIATGWRRKRKRLKAALNPAFRAALLAR